MWEIIMTNTTIEQEQVTVYGVRRGSTVIADITSNADNISEFVKILNRNDVSECHISDILEDMLPL